VRPKLLSKAVIAVAAMALLLCWHPWQPRWTDSASSREGHGLIHIACLFVLGTGVLLILRGGHGWLLERFGRGEGPLRIFPGMALKNVVPLQRHRPIPLITEFPNFGLVWGSVLYVLLNIFAVTMNVVPRGLWLNFKEVPKMGIEKSPWEETLGVYVDGKRQFYVNGKRIGREELGTKLKEELGRRMVWTVYFEAGMDDPFMDTAFVIDTIQGLGAKVVWITPKMREKLNQTAGTHR
jgi:biopolymer transport protein ExbD